MISVQSGPSRIFCIYCKGLLSTSTTANDNQYHQSCFDEMPPIPKVLLQLEYRPSWKVKRFWKVFNDILSTLKKNTHKESLKTLIRLEDGCVDFSKEYLPRREITGISFARNCFNCNMRIEVESTETGLCIEEMEYITDLEILFETNEDNYYCRDFELK